MRPSIDCNTCFVRQYRAQIPCSVYDYLPQHFPVWQQSIIKSYSLTEKLNGYSPLALSPTTFRARTGLECVIVSDGVGLRLRMAYPRFTSLSLS